MAAVTRDLTRLASDPLGAGLYLVATPIGNLGDITLRALSVLARADIVYCEDTRHSAKLLQHFSLSPTTRPLHDHNEDSERTRVLRDLAAGKRIALISDAGTPLISDPGFKLVRDCAAAGHPVICIPGASSVITAMAAIGLVTPAPSWP
ncbi:MAG: ribosomal RNA small subunit methyltransferase I, partial [Hyphomicrobium sp.]